MKNRCPSRIRAPSGLLIKFESEILPRRAGVCLGTTLVARESASRRTRMAVSLAIQRSAGILSRRSPYLAACRYQPRSGPQHTPTRSFLSWFKKSKHPKLASPKTPEPVLSEDDLFHQFSKSPFPAIRARGEAIQKLAPCPVCATAHHDHDGMHTHAYAQAQPKAVKFECPDCGWPTHCSEEHWKEDEEHRKYCGRLREVNEDEHDLRSGRRLREFELPGA